MSFKLILLKKRLFSRPLAFFILASLLLCLGVALDYTGNSLKYASGKIARDAEQALQKEERKLQLIVDSAFSLFTGATDKNATVLFLNERKNSLNRSGSGILGYENNELIFWSSNAISFEDRRLEAPGNQMLHLKNGWYDVITKSDLNKRITGLLLVRQDYAYQNKFLQNTFNRKFSIPTGSTLSKIPQPGFLEIRSISGKVLFYISVKYTENPFTTAIQMLYLLALAFFSLAIHFMALKLIKRHPFYLFALMILVIALRILMIYLEMPEEFYRLALFNPQYYASSFFLRSLGDLFINVFIGCYFALFAYKAFKDLKKSEVFRDKIFLKTSFVASWGAGIYFIVAFINSLITGLIINSQIPFNVNNIFELNAFSVIGFVITGMLFFIVYIVTRAFVNFIIEQHFNTKRIALLCLLSNTGFLLIFMLFHSTEVYRDYTIITHIFISLLIAAIWFMRQRNKTSYPVAGTMIILSLFSLYATFIIYNCNTLKEQESRKVFALKLEKEQDPIAEHLFVDIEVSIKNDEALASYFIGSPNAQDVIRRLNQFYFNGYWSRYETKIYCFDVYGNPLPKSLYTDTIDYFERLITYQASPTYSSHFYFLNNDNRVSYLAKIPVTSDGRFVGTIFAEVNSKFIQENSGFPELLLSEEAASKAAMPDYSYAQYIDNKLVAHYGKFSYVSNSLKYGAQEKETEFRNIEKFNHLFYKAKSNKVIIVSKVADTWLEYVTLFSYLFTFFGLFSLLLWLGSHYNYPYFQFNFAGRIQLAILIVVLVSLITIGGGTIYYIFNKYNTRQFEQISERIGFLSDAVENLFPGSQKITKNDIDDNLRHRLGESAVHSDYNLFDLEGNLLFSTQPKIVDQGLISNRMNPEAYQHLAEEGYVQYVHTENIGNLSFIAAYVPVRNLQNTIIAYLDLPYFSRQTELKKEISSFLVTLINVYILLLALSIIMALVISNYIAKPLKLVQEKLAHIKLGKKNELIDWRQKDEIGLLVNEYNRMVGELSANAELLAKSEREGAWREMAKQVAHEIKNPLTPMKLSVQYLLHAWKDKSADMDGIVERISKTMVQQIDTLSAIATAFSNFAQMPKTNIETIDLAAILNDIINLFEETDNVDVILDATENGNFLILADRDQLLRVFTNLVKNAVQAMPSERTGKIVISLSKSDENYIVSVSDNGSGIPEDMREKIFTPNFTTKTGGMGLGLAMVKNSIENANGKIWFETQTGKGTTFFVQLPVAKPL